MAAALPQVIEALRATARALEKAPDYQWGHMGACNCGFLAQQVTRRTRAEIHQFAMARHGNWTEQLNDYCPDSGLPLDLLIADLLAFGFSLADLKHLEWLSDEAVLQALPGGKRFLKHNVKEDVILYLRTWAAILEEKFASQIALPAGNRQEEVTVAV
jgi:hypothetical protein